MRKRAPKGQVFLADNEVLRRVADATAVAADETVLEIGMGRGELTQHLVRRAAKVIAVEIEERYTDAAAAAFADYDNLTVVHANILDVDWDELLPPEGRVVVVGNIPFYLTAPLLRLLFEHRRRLTRWSLLLQREVAERICAGPGGKDYGALSVKMQFWGEPRLAFVVPATAFEPRPKVDAALVNYYYYEAPEAGLGRPELFDAFVDFVFGGRRKKIGNRLASFLGSGRGGAQKIAAKLGAAGFDADARAERFSPDDFVKLYALLEPHIEV